MPGLCVATNDASKQRRTLLRRAHNFSGVDGFNWSQVLVNVLNCFTHLLLRNEWRTAMWHGLCEVSSKTGWVEITILGIGEGVLWSADWKTCPVTLSVGMMLSSRMFVLGTGFPLPFVFCITLPRLVFHLSSPFSPFLFFKFPSGDTLMVWKFNVPPKFSKNVTSSYKRYNGVRSCSLPSLRFVRWTFLHMTIIAPRCDGGSGGPCARTKPIIHIFLQIAPLRVRSPQKKFWICQKADLLEFLF